MGTVRYRRRQNTSDLIDITDKRQSDKLSKSFYSIKSPTMKPVVQHKSPSGRTNDIESDGDNATNQLQDW